MTKKEFDKKWKGVDPDKLSDEQLQQFKQDCFAMYEQGGFLDTFNSPYDEQGEHNGMAFKVIRRATTEECDLEAMPIWLIEFENGDTALCYPEEICKVEKNVRMISLEDILQQHFRCSKPFLKNPRKILGEEYTEYFTSRGGKAYGQLVALIEDLGKLGVLSRPENIIDQLDTIVRGEC